VLAQQHAKHGGLRRVFGLRGDEPCPHARLIDANQQAKIAFAATQMQHQFVFAGLVDFVYARTHKLLELDA